MPVCTQCASYVECIYTQYSESNIRLEQCVGSQSCLNFADRYAEKDTLNITLDLILLKNVLLHLLYNRNTAPRRIKGDGTVILPDLQAQRVFAEHKRRVTILHIGSLLVFLDSLTRWFYSRTVPTQTASDIERFLSWENIRSFLETLFTCLVEMVLFHTAIIISAVVVFKLFSVLQKRNVASGVWEEFRLSHLPLALLYASLTKLFLLSLLVVWRPTSQAEGNIWRGTQNGLLLKVYHLFDDETLDREWLLRNLMGGMASGFAIRVVLNGRPIIAASIVLAAWLLKAMAAYVFSEYIWNVPDNRQRFISSMP
ncbi:hypothetical protein FRC19_009925 [Serendipita sp. 401]|nr:hypothetical protein FRC19_009925 [Serendipita sp. 401]